MTAHACNYTGGTAKVGEGTMTIVQGMTTDMLVQHRDPGRDPADVLPRYLGDHRW